MNRVDISVKEVCGTSLPIFEEHATLLYDRLSIAMYNGDQAVVSFDGIEGVTPSFLSVSIGNLYRDHDPVVGIVGHGREITKRSCDIFVKDINTTFSRMLTRVIFESKRYYEQLYSEGIDAV